MHLRLPVLLGREHHILWACVDPYQLAAVLGTHHPSQEGAQPGQEQLARRVVNLGHGGLNWWFKQGLGGISLALDEAVRGQLTFHRGWMFLCGKRAVPDVGNLICPELVLGFQDH